MCSRHCAERFDAHVSYKGMYERSYIFELRRKI